VAKGTNKAIIKELTDSLCGKPDMQKDFETVLKI
jgi:hypothetical protein